MIEQFNNFFSNYFINPITNFYSYNLFNSITYTMILFIIVLFLKKKLKINKIEINNTLLIYLIPFFILEIILRLINDTNIFNNSHYLFLFSTPLIYLLLIFFVLLSFFLGNIAEKLFEKRLLLIFPIPLLIFFISFSFFEDQILIPKHIPAHIEIMICFIMIIFFYLIKIKSQISTFHLTILFSGLYSMALSLIIFYQLYNNILQNSLIEKSHQVSFLPLLLIIIFFYLIIKIIKSRYYFINEPLIKWLIISMSLDVFATYSSYSSGNNPQHLMTQLIFSNKNGIYTFFLFKIIILISMMEFIKKQFHNGINIFTFKENNNFIRLMIIVIIIINFTTSLRVISKLILNI